MDERLVARIGLGYLAALSLVIGVWATVGPRSFYDDFPGFGRMWIAPDGPYNEHLVRDVGGLYLAFGALVVAAAIALSRALVTTAAVAALATGLPHLAYHAANTDVLDTADTAVSLVGLGGAVAFPILLLWLAPRVGTGR
ncbi:MAG: hypothetical protein AAF548_06935 [Actinomycetota bacterium]